MMNLNQGLFGVVVTASILTIAPSALAFNVVFGDRDTENTRSEFTNSLNTNSLSTVIDDGTNFGAAPAAVSVPSVSRNGTINGKNFAYTIYDVDFSTSPTGVINPGNTGGDIDELDNVTVETPVRQDTAVGSYSWGVDSATGARSTPNAALFDFTGNSIGHFGVDLHDFEAGANNSFSGASGEIRVYDSSNLVFSYDLQFPALNYGDGESIFVGITANNPNEFFDQIAFVLGDDDVGGNGYTEQWAADGFTFGEAYNESIAVPFEFSPTLGLIVVGGLWMGNKARTKISQIHRPR